MSIARLFSKRISTVALLSLMVVTSLSCEKYSSPNKVKRIIVEGRWKFTNAFIDNVNVTNVYEPYSFSFAENGNITVHGDATITGNWSTGIEKNPTTLNLTLTPFAPFYDLNADWTVTTCKNDRMTLELDGATATDVLILSKVE
jgi:uncharacterized membrane protein